MGEWYGRRVLVTGAAGFVGSHLVERLVRDGARTRAFVRYNSRDEWGHLDDSDVRGDIDVIRGDIRDASLVDASVRGCDVVFHLAALIGIPYSYDAPDSYVRTNVGGTLNVLDSARRVDCRVVVTSTSEVYGTAQRVPMDETHPLNPQSPYAATKVGADLLALSYHRSFGTRVAVLRPFNTYGPRQSARAVIPTIATQLVQGSQVRIGSLRPERDFTYVTDTVDAFVRLGRDDAGVGQVLNVGTGVAVSIGDLVERIARVCGRTAEIVKDEERVRPEASEVERLVADAARARSVLGWAPSVALDDGLRRTIEWIAAHGDVYRVGSYTR